MIKHNFYKWIFYWIEMFCAFMGIITLSYYKPIFDLKFLCWDVRKEMEKKKYDRQRTVETKKRRA